MRQQNKTPETALHLARMLARDPDDAFTHANAGWNALQRRQHREAETHFREALRLVAGAFWLGTPVFIAGCGLTASAFPLSLTLTNCSPAGRWIFGSIGFSALLLAPLLARDTAFELLPGSLGTGVLQESSSPPC